MALTKARLSSLVLVTTAIGCVMGTPAGASFDWTVLLLTIIGTAMCAGAASALNEIIEVRRDALMNRTRTRPLPAGSISLTHAFIIAMLLAQTGLSILAVWVNLLAAGLALLTIVIYVLIYTPLKVRTSLNTLVGAVCGAIPPMIGWAAASGSLDRGAWVLGALLFVWQLPHFLALAWLYRDDYARGGFAMLPVVDSSGRLTCMVVVLTSLALLPVGIVATLSGMAGWFYAAGSLLLGLWMVALSVRLHDRRTAASARGVFLASIAYLPLLLCLMVIDRGPIMGAPRHVATIEPLGRPAPPLVVAESPLTP
jgi:protoheme IX farnesyltransferase